jgi:hypothetical protein
MQSGLDMGRLAVGVAVMVVLLTIMGLVRMFVDRTLAPDDPAQTPREQGSAVRRDGPVRRRDAPVAAIVPRGGGE